MASKYDDFWLQHLDQLAALVESAAEGRPAEVQLTGLQALGQRSSWYGSAVIRDAEVNASMAHMVALANVVTRAGLCARWPTSEFRFTVNGSCRLTVVRAGEVAQRQWRAPSIAMRTAQTTVESAPTDVADTCAEIHRVLDGLPLLESPDEVAFANGLYFFYEKREDSEHAPSGRVVRVGNHPRAQDRLKARLRDHYRTREGAKNGSVFRRYLGGALMRRDEPRSRCLLPGPGAGHWEHQGSAACVHCGRYEDEVTACLRRSFRFRCVRIDDMAERNRFEGLLIASLAACPACRPSPTWLGLHAYSPVVSIVGTMEQRLRRSRATRPS